MKVKSQTDKLVQVRNFISEAARTFGFKEDDVDKIALAVDEACTNIIKYAYEHDTNKEIEVSVHTSNGKFEVVITDYGKDFNPNAVKLPDMQEYVKHYQKGGLGMYLMKSLMDRIEYNITPGVKNEVRLTKFL